MTIHVYEGVDRAGKSTRVKEVMRVRRERLCLAVHFDAPPKGRDSRHVLDEMEAVFAIQAARPEIDFVLDRGHVSWFLYEFTYRDASRSSLDHFRRWEEVMRQLYPGVEVKLHLVERPEEDIFRSDDGDSTWATREELHAEMELFRRFCAKSKWFVAPLEVRA